VLLRSEGISLLSKSPLAPAIDYAQGMLFQREGIGSYGLNSPFEKRGIKGILLANGEYDFMRTWILTFQKLKNIGLKSMFNNGICS
jgi:hypothetical protein